MDKALHGFINCKLDKIKFYQNTVKQMLLCQRFTSWSAENGTYN